MYLMSNAILAKSLLETLNMIHSFVNGDYCAIQMAYKKLIILENEHNLPHIVFLLKDLVKTNENQKTLLSKHQK